MPSTHRQRLVLGPAGVIALAAASVVTSLAGTGVAAADHAVTGSIEQVAHDCPDALFTATGTISQTPLTELWVSYTDGNVEDSTTFFAEDGHFSFTGGMDLADPLDASAEISWYLYTSEGEQPVHQIGQGSFTVPACEDADPVERYVEQVYNDLFDRAPDPQGLQDWSTRLKNGTPYGEVANGITYSREFRSGLIADSYAYYLGREPDPVGLENWLTAMANGLHIEQMDAGFIASDEFYEQAGGSDHDWIAGLYGAVLQREAGQSEIDFWQAELDASGDYHRVALGFLYSTEYLTGVVDSYYQYLLGRGIDPAGRRTWVTAIQRGARDEEIIASIVSSAEYRSNVGRWTPLFVEPADRYADTIVVTYSENLDCATVDADGSDYAVTVNGSPHPDSSIRADCYPRGIWDQVVPQVELVPASGTTAAFDDEVHVSRRAGSTVRSLMGVAQPLDDTVTAVAMGADAD